MNIPYLQLFWSTYHFSLGASFTNFPWEKLILHILTSSHREGGHDSSQGEVLGEMGQRV